MTAVLLGMWSNDSDEWHHARSQGIGGSEIAAIVGLSPYESAFSLWHRKRGNLGPVDGNAQMEWGHRLEGAIAGKWLEGKQTEPRRLHRPAGMYRSSRWPWMLANPDGVVTEAVELWSWARPEPFATLPTYFSALWECKTADSSQASEWGPSGTDQIPPHYAAQVLWYQDVMELRDPAHLAVLIGQSDYREYVLPYDPRGAAWLRWHGRRFWRSVVAGVQPELDHSDATYQTVRDLHPDIDKGQAVELDPDVWYTFAGRLEEYEHAERHHDLWRTRLLASMGDAQFGTIDGVRVVRRQASSSGRPSLRVIPRKRFRPRTIKLTTGGNDDD